MSQSKNQLPAHGTEGKDGILGRLAVSIIIPTYNEQKNIGRLLSSIDAQLAVDSEVIVVDQGSSDRTVEIANHYGCRVIVVPRSSIYTPPGPNRNIGAAAANGSVLLHLDADMELGSPFFLQRLADILDEAHQAAVVHEIDIAQGFWSKCKAIERQCYLNSDLEAARAVTRLLFEKVGGYHEGISSGEDFYVSKSYARETRLARDPRLFLFHHTGHLSLRYLIRKKFGYGRTARQYLRIARESQLDSWQQMLWLYLRIYFKNMRLIFRDPVHFCGLFPLRLLEFCAVCCGMVAGRPWRGA